MKYKCRESNFKVGFYNEKSKTKNQERYGLAVAHRRRCRCQQGFLISSIYRGMGLVLRPGARLQRFIFFLSDLPVMQLSGARTRTSGSSATASAPG